MNKIEPRESGTLFLVSQVDLCKIIDKKNNVAQIKEAINTELVNFRMNDWTDQKKYPHNFRYAGISKQLILGDYLAEAEIFHTSPSSVVAKSALSGPMRRPRNLFSIPKGM